MSEKHTTKWNFFIDHFRFTFIIVAAIVLFGVFAIFQLPKESDPDVDIPIASVVTVFPGASPLDVEELITNKIEDKLSRIAGIDTMTSVSRSGLSQITVEFDVDTERQKVVGDVNDAVDEVVAELPRDAEEPLVSEVDVSDQPFMSMSLGGPFTVPELTRAAKLIEDVVEGINGVSNIQVIGGQDEEIQVIVNKHALDTYGLSIRQVTGAIASANSDIPIGAIETAGERFNVRLSGRLKDVEAVGSVPVTSVNGVPVLLSDIADVRMGVTEAASLSRLSTDNVTSEAAVTLMAFKASGGDIVDTSRAIRKEIQTILENDLPEGMEFLVLIDFADFIQDDLRSLTRNGLATVFIVFLILLFFLGTREAVMAGIAIPLAFLMTFSFLLYVDISINFMTLFSLILSLGILVDSAIVINEGMNKKIRSGLEPFAAAKAVVHEYQWPLIAGTLTTVFAFVPMLLTSGIIGEYIRTIPVTVSAVLISSLFVALGIVTSISAVYAKKQQKKGKDTVKQGRRAELLFNYLRKEYVVRVRTLLQERKQQRKVFWFSLLALLISFSFPMFGILKVNMFPTSNEPRFTIDFEMPIGTPVERTAEVMGNIEDELQKDSLIESYVVNVGSGSPMGGGSSVGDAHKGYIEILLQEKNRPTSIEVVERYQDIFDDFQPGVVRVSQGNFGPPQEAPVVVRIAGKQLDELDRLVGEFETILEDIPGTVNIRSSEEQTNGEFVLHVDRLHAERMGISTTDLALVLRNAINGTEATSINDEGDEVEIIVKYALNQSGDEKSYRTDIDTVRSLTIATPTGDIPLSSLVDIRLEHSRFFIEHQDGDRISKVTAFTEEGTNAFEVFKIIEEKMKDLDIPTGYSVTLGGENEDINKSFADMFRAMILAVFMIAALLVLQFNSFKQSLIILFTIPLAMIGVFPGLALLRLPLSFPGIIGIVALVGIVVNNAIILIDAINNKRKEGKEIDDALLEAGSARIEPIILTTITTMFGLLPLAITEEVWRSLGFAIIFGLLCSTVLTLLVIPTLYKRLVK